MFDISDSSSRSQTRCLWHILALLYPTSITARLKVRYQCREQESPSFSADRALCLWRRNRKTDRRGKYLKYCLHLASFQNVDSCETDVVNLIFFSLSLFLFVCKKNLWASAYSRQNTIIIHSTANTDREPQSKKKRVTNVDLWKWTVHFSSHSSFIFQKWEGSGGASPGITAVITYLLHGHACQFRVQLFFSVTPL